MRHNIFYILFIFFSVICNFLAYSQEFGRPFLRNYSPKTYDAHSQNFLVMQNKHGIMYFGNGDGLMEYDGVNFRILPLPNKNIIRSMAIDSSGVVYVGSIGYFGYIKTDSTGKTVFVDLVAQLNPKDKEFKDVSEIKITSNAVFFRTAKKIFRVTSGEGNKQKITVWDTDTKFTNCFVFQDKFFVCQTGKGLLVLEKENLVPANGGSAFNNFTLNTTTKFSNDELYLITTKAIIKPKNYSGLLAYSPFKAYKDTTFLRKITTEVDSFIIKNSVGSIEILKNKNILLASNRLGAIVISPKGKLLQELSQEKIGLQNDAIYKSFTDSENATWFVMNKGVARLELQSSISFWNETNSGIKGTPEFILRHKGTLYIATHTGIFYIDSKNNIVRIPPFAEQCWTLYNFITPQNDTLLMAGTSSGVYEIKDFKGIPKHVMYNSSIKVSGQGIFEFYQSKKNPNRLLIATGENLSSMLYDNGKWLIETPVKNLQDNFRSVLEDAQGNIWLGAFRGGIYRVIPSYNTTNSLDFANPKSIKHYTDKDGIPSLKNILLYHFIHPIEVSPQGGTDVNTSKTPPSRDAGLLVFATEKGLIIFDEKTNKFIPFKGNTTGNIIGKFPEQLYNGTRDIFSFKQDFKGNLWLSGLFNKAGEIAFCEKWSDGNYDYINKPFKNIPEMMVLAFYVEGDSICWVGGSEGLYRFDRKLMKNTQNSFETLIRKVRINQDSTVFYGEFPQETQSLIGKILSHSSNIQADFMKLKMPYEYNSITIEYAAPNFTDESNTLYSHFLEGYDETWSSWIKLTQKEYTNLHEGNYTFKVKAKDIFGKESEIATYQFSILSPWYRSWWAYIFYGLLVLIFVYFIVNYYTKSLKKDKEKLEILVQNRTQEITLKNAELEQQKEEIVAQAENLREANNEILAKNEQVEKAFYNIQTISEIGQKVTASLDLENVIHLVYESVNSLMDATCFGIGVYMPKAKSIIFQGFIERGVVLPTDVEIIDKNKPTLAAICLMQQREILINNIYADIVDYGVEIKQGSSEIEKSIIYLPLTIENRTVGVITVQSFEINRYQEGEVNMLRALASYISIAIENSHSYEVINQRNRSITDSIRYAETIQKAMLPSEKEMQETLGDYFVFYKPKDVVSGDFYWLSKVKEMVFVAVVDCTGHGVPGAFMSMISISLLHEAVNQRDIFEPSAILHHINNEIRSALKQDESRNRDGMDLVLCKIELQNNGTKQVNKITFAGAKRPLFYSENGVICEIRGTRKNIGGNQKQIHTFEQTEIFLADGEMLYLSTDGYSDQANEKRENFGVLRFVAFLQTLIIKPIEEQKLALIHTLATHQGYTEQRDDITVMGIRL